MTARLVTCLGALVVVWAAGCGGGGTNPNAPAKLSGKVTYKSAAVTGGIVTVHPSEGAAVYAIPISPDGSFSGFDLPAGDVAITIETESVNKKNIQYGAGKGGDKGKSSSPIPESAPTGAAEVYVKIPAKYADKKTSGLTMKLERGQNTKNFELVD